MRRGSTPRWGDSFATFPPKNHLLLANLLYLTNSRTQQPSLPAGALRPAAPCAWQLPDPISPRARQPPCARKRMTSPHPITPRLAAPHNLLRNKYLE